MNNNPIIIRIDGGLGNHLFMLFASISKAIDEKRNFLIYPEIKNSRKYYFEDFYSWLFPYHISHCQYAININKPYNEPSNNEYNQIPDNCDLINGYFQSEKYFIHNYNTLRQMFKIDEFQNKYKLKDDNYICIHFRIGDVITIQNNFILSSNYYTDAINILKKKLGNDFFNFKFLVFGEKQDDITITKKLKDINSSFDNNLTFVKIYDFKEDFKDYEQLMIMSNCKHFIIANSTFSWWGSYLSKSNTKIIICPTNSTFHSQTNNIRSHYYPNNYIQINTK